MPFDGWAHLQPAKVLHLLLSAFLFTTPVSGIPYNKQFKFGDEALYILGL